MKFFKTHLLNTLTFRFPFKVNLWLGVLLRLCKLTGILIASVVKSVMMDWQTLGLSKTQAGEFKECKYFSHINLIFQFPEVINN